MTNSADSSTTGLVADVTSHTFDEVVFSSPIPVAVDIWTEWCGPCKTLAPIVDDLARQLAGRLRFLKLDAEEHPDLARRFEVMSFPTLLVFRDGELVKRLVGARGRHSLLEELSELV